MFDLAPIGTVRSSRATPEDDHWGSTTATIELAPHLPAESLDGLSEFSHLEIVYVFDRVTPEKIVTGARHPRNNPAWPKVGIFAQRGKNRPNRLGVTAARLVGIGRPRPRVAETQAIHGTAGGET